MPASTTCPSCPKCLSDRTRYTVKAASGRYCYCDACGNAWYYDTGFSPPESQPTSPGKDTNAYPDGADSRSGRSKAR